MAVTSRGILIGTVTVPSSLIGCASWILRRSIVNPCTAKASAKSLDVTDPNILSSFPTCASMVRVTAETFLACTSISSFSFFAFSAATRFTCSNALMLRLLASTAFLRGNRKFRANPSRTSIRSPRWPTPSIVSCRMTFIPLTPSVGKEVRIRGIRLKSQFSIHFSGRVGGLDRCRRAPISWPTGRRE